MIPRGQVVDIYWHSRKRMWSIRHDGRVRAHLPTAQLIDVRFIVHEAARLRALHTGQKAVFAFARGMYGGPVDEEPYGTQIRLNPREPTGFTSVPYGFSVRKACIVHLRGNGTCWVVL